MTPKNIQGTLKGKGFQAIGLGPHSNIPLGKGMPRELTDGILATLQNLIKEGPESTLSLNALKPAVDHLTNLKGDVTDMGNELTRQSLRDMMKMSADDIEAGVAAAAELGQEHNVAAVAELSNEAAKEKGMDNSPAPSPSMSPGPKPGRRPRPR